MDSSLLLRSRLLPIALDVAYDLDCPGLSPLRVGCVLSWDAASSSLVPFVPRGSIVLPPNVCNANTAPALGESPPDLYPPSLLLPRVVKLAKTLFQRGPQVGIPIQITVMNENISKPFTVPSRASCSYLSPLSRLRTKQ